MNPAWMQALQKDLAGSYDPITGQWISSSTGSYQDPATGQWYGLLNNAGGPNPYGDASGRYTEGSGKPFDPYNIMDASGKDTGQDGQYSPPDDSMKVLMSYLAAIAGVGFGGAALAGAPEDSGALSQTEVSRAAEVVVEASSSDASSSDACRSGASSAAGMTSAEVTAPDLSPARSWLAWSRKVAVWPALALRATVALVVTTAVVRAAWSFVA